MDRFTKFAHFLSLKHRLTAATIAGGFIKEVVRLHRFHTFPASTVSASTVSHRDIHEFFGGSSFDSKAWLWREAPAIILKRMVNRSILTRNWKPICGALWTGNQNSGLIGFHGQNSGTPHLTMYLPRWPHSTHYMGKTSVPLIHVGHDQTPVDSLDNDLQEHDAIMDNLRVNLLRDQQKMKFWLIKRGGSCNWKLGTMYTSSRINRNFWLEGHVRS